MRSAFRENIDLTHGKKQSLKKVQDQDALAKMEFKNRQSKLSR